MSGLLARLEAVELADASVAHIELWLSDQPVEEESVFAAMVVVGDAAGRFVAVYSPRREEWGSPGGWRERGESVVECALREVAEETGLRLAPGELRPVGFERFEPVSAGGRWPAQGGALQLFRAVVAGAGGDLHASESDAVAPAWVTADQFAALAGGRFWWPLVAHVLQGA
ncbi:NUDIX hydrolase [Pedococcus sp.]|jgi:8-oxo-dGTP pyrophosphatase MutT (NUDIX family)|uniref:NUDIX hydrolase n=1 Tax=Pedococcus sp. TaxID=2860345 RepID=UPI002E0FB91C|nr:NUDIX hydrolase [Pedococcus sp.]